MSDNYIIKTENLRMEYLGGKVVALDDVSETNQLDMFGSMGTATTSSVQPKKEAKKPKADEAKSDDDGDSQISLF